LPTLALPTLTGLAALALAAFPAALPALRLLLTWLTTLTGLPFASKLTRLRLSRLTVGTSAETSELIAQPRQLVHGPVDLGIPRCKLSAAQRTSRVADLLTQLLQIAGHRCFGRFGDPAATQLIRAELQPCVEIVFVQALERGPQFAGSRRLCGGKLARRAAHLLGEPP
jgi:hypothetical protein